VFVAQVRELALWSVEVGPIQSLGRGLEGLERLELRGAGLGPVDVQRIGAALVGQQRLTVLELSGNTGIKCEVSRPSRSPSHHWKEALQPVATVEWAVAVTEPACLKKRISHMFLTLWVDVCRACVCWLGR
jgi:hypothetical protein